MLNMHSPKLYGTVTVGERGQIAIPTEARDELGIKPGEKLLIFQGMHKGALMITRLDQLEQFFAKMSERMDNFKHVIKQAKHEANH